MRTTRRIVTGLLPLAAFSGAWILVPPPDHPPTATDDVTAESLIDEWIEALGGMDVYHGLTGASFTLTTEIWDPVSGRLKRTRPRYVTIARLQSGQAARIERWEGNDFIQHGFSGVTEWAVMNGEPLGPGDKDFDEARYVSGDVWYWIGLPFKLKDPGLHLHYDGFDSKGIHQVRVTFGDGVGDHNDTWFYGFQAGRAMPVSIGYREEGREDINHTYWEDIRAVDGYPFAGRRVHLDAEGRIWKVLATSDFVLNPSFDPGWFSSP